MGSRVVGGARAFVSMRESGAVCVWLIGCLVVERRRRSRVRSVRCGNRWHRTINRWHVPGFHHLLLPRVHPPWCPGMSRAAGPFRETGSALASGSVAAPGRGPGLPSVPLPGCPRRLGLWSFLPGPPDRGPVFRRRAVQEVVPGRRWRRRYRRARTWCTEIALGSCGSRWRSDDTPDRIRRTPGRGSRRTSRHGARRPP